MPGALPPGLDRRALVAHVADALDGLERSARAVVALSGGPDSSALAVLVRSARPDLVLTAVHIRHGLRDDAADRAAAQRVAVAVGIDFEVVEVSVTAAGQGVEAAARDARHAALRRAAVVLGARVILLGHTADDQAETVLLALGRGTGVRGLGGMRPARTEDGILVARPLLACRRADVRAVVTDLDPVEDPTNDDPWQRRRRVRTEVLPALAGLSGGPGDPVALLTRLADLARDDADLLDGLAGREARRLVSGWGAVRLVRADGLAALPPALARRVVRALLAAVRGGLTGLDAASVDRVLALAPGGATSVAGGVEVTANGGWLAAAPADLEDLPTRELAEGGAVELPELGLTLAPGDDEDAVVPPRARAPRQDAASARLRAGGLVVRARRPGDRVPGSSRSLGDRMTDLGVPRAVRGLVPVVAYAEAPDLAVWVPGIAAAPDHEGGTGVPLVLRGSTTIAFPEGEEGAAWRVRPRTTSKMS